MERLLQLSKRTNKCPLGCGALAGNAFGIDRVAMAEELGFDEIMPNSMAAVADRDPILEMMQWSSMLMLHISRISTDLIDYSTAEFGFVRLADAYTTGSSLMPQKKNGKSFTRHREHRFQTHFFQRTPWSSSVANPGASAAPWSD